MDDLTVTTTLLSAAAVGYVAWTATVEDIAVLCREVGIESPDEFRALVKELGEIRRQETPGLDADSYMAGVIEGALFTLRMLRMPRDVT